MLILVVGTFQLTVNRNVFFRSQHCQAHGNILVLKAGLTFSPKASIRKFRRQNVRNIPPVVAHSEEIRISFTEGSNKNLPLHACQIPS